MTSCTIDCLKPYLDLGRLIHTPSFCWSPQTQGGLQKDPSHSFGASGAAGVGRGPEQGVYGGLEDGQWDPLAEEGEADLLCQCLVADLQTFKKCPQSIFTSSLLL